MTYLQKEAAKYRDSGFHKAAEPLEQLLSPSPYAQRVRDWIKKHARKGLGSIMRSMSECQDWEAELWFLSRQFLHFQPMGVWEKASAEERIKHSMKVANLARRLAVALNEDIRPYYPPALDLFDPERAVDIIRCLPSEQANSLLSCTGFSIDWRDGYERGSPAWYEDNEPKWESPAHSLSMLFCFPEYQKLSSMLKRLADHTEEQAREPKRDQRPSVPGADARAFARELANHFQLFFNLTPNEVIAACVAIKFPELDPPPDEATIRRWRGAR